MKSNVWLGVVAGLVVAAATSTASAEDASTSGGNGTGTGDADASASLSFGTSGSSTTASATTDGTPAPAETGKKEDSFNRTFAFGLSGGLGAPLGYGGILVNVAPIKYLILEVGAGAGGRFGPAVAEMVRGGFPDGNQMFTLGLGFSQNVTTSGIRDKFPSSTADSVPGVSHFLNIEVAYEYRFVKQRFWGRLGLGLATLLNANKYKGLCGSNNTDCSKDETGFTPIGVAQNQGTVTAYVHLDVGGFFGF
jgi:hypothetical protein